MQHRLGFIGCGNMAQAIAGGAIKRGVIDAKDVIASDPSDQNRGVFADWGCATATENQAVAAEAEQVLLAVKPQIYPRVAPDLAAYPSDEQVLISIMAGLSSSKIAELIGSPRRVVRVMPNTPAWSVRAWPASRSNAKRPRRHRRPGSQGARKLELSGR